MFTKINLFITFCINSFNKFLEMPMANRWYNNVTRWDLIKKYHYAPSSCKNQYNGVHLIQ